ncbi:cupin domain-containing protein [Agromyces sp. NPDC004153]
MSEIDTRTHEDAVFETAPDGSNVRVLCRVDGGSTAEFSLTPGTTSRAVAHRTIEEVWFVLEGTGQMWRRRGDTEVYAQLSPGTSLTIPLGTAFQFRADGDVPLRILGVTIPPWPGDGAEATDIEGPWVPSS